MSHIVNYIRALPFADFENIREVFTTKNCRVLDNELSYMIVPAADYTVYAHESPEFRAAVEEAVGVIFRKHDNALLCFGYPKTQELTETSECPIEGTIAATQYLGGTLIRAYFDGYYWRLANNGAIDAYNNYWISSKSIGQLFDECLSKIYRSPTTFAASLAHKLNPSYTYEFILQHPEIHLEVFDRPFIYHIGTFDNQQLVYVDVAADHIPPPLIGYFETYQEALEMMREQNFLGLTLCAKGNAKVQQARFKIIHPDYKRKQALLGRTSNLYLRYLECKAEKTDKELLKAFPSIRHHASWVEKCLSNMTREIYEVYVKKYIKRQQDTFINYYYQPILSAIHQYHKRTNIRVGADTVYGEISNYHPKRINFLLNGLEFIKTNDVQLRPEPVAEPVAPVPLSEEDAAIKEEEHEITFQYLLTISDEDYYTLIHNRFMPIIITELNLDLEETSDFYSGIEEHIFSMLFAQDMADTKMCLEDASFLISRIHEYKDYIIAEMF